MPRFNRIRSMGGRARHRSGPWSSGFNAAKLSPLIWLDASKNYTLFQNSNRTTAVTADTDPVGYWGDLSSNLNNATQATSTKRPTYKVNISNSLPMLLPDSTDDIWSITGIPLTGVFTMYCVGTRALGATFLPFGSSAAAGAYFGIIDNRVYFGNDAGVAESVAYTGSNGTILLRMRRNSSNQVFYKSTGVAEKKIAIAVSGTTTLTNVGARPGASQWNGSTNKFGEILLTASDLVETSPGLDASYTASLVTKWGVTF